MKPSEFCKSHGLKLKQVSFAAKTSEQNLINWSKNKPDLFRLVVLGAREEFLSCQNTNTEEERD